MRFALALLLTTILPAAAAAQTCGVMEFGGTGDLITRNIVVSLTSLTASEIEANGACESVEQYVSSQFEDGCPGEEDCLAAFAVERELERVVTGAVHYDGEEFSLRLRLYHVSRGRFTGSIQGEVPRDPGQRADHVIRSAATLFGVAPSTTQDEAPVEEEDTALADRLDLPPPEEFESPTPEREYDAEPTEDEELDAVLESLSLESLDGFAADEDEARGGDEEESADHEYDEEDRYEEPRYEEPRYEEPDVRVRDRGGRDRRSGDEEEEEEPLIEDDLQFDEEPLYDDEPMYGNDIEESEPEFESESEPEPEPEREAADELVIEDEPVVEDEVDDDAEAAELRHDPPHDSSGERSDRTAARADVPNVQGPPRAALRITAGLAYFQNPSLDLAVGFGLALHPAVWLDAEVGGWLSRSPQDTADEQTHTYFLVPASVGVVFKKPDSPVRPFVGVGALLFSYFIDPDSGKVHVAPGARVQGGAEFAVGRGVGLVVNGTAGLAYSKDIAALSNEAGYSDAAFVASVRGGILFRF